MAAGVDSIFFIAGGVLAVAALVVLWRALMSDRSRGRRRCPRCWYDMSGVPGSLTCSECGHAATRERKLFKTRRRWGLAVVGALMLLLADACTFGPRVRQEGWFAVVPTTTLILMMPSLRSDHPKAFDALMERADEGKLWQWQWEILLKRCHDGQDLPWTFKFDVRLDGGPAAPINGWLRFGVESQFSGRVILPGSSSSPPVLSPFAFAPLRLAIRAPGADGKPSFTLSANQATELPRLYELHEGQSVIATKPGPHGNRVIELDVVVERQTYTLSSPAPGSGASALTFPSGRRVTLPASFKTKTAIGWTPIHSERVRLEVKNDPQPGGATKPVDRPELAAALEKGARFTIDKDCLWLTQDFAVSAGGGVCCPVRIDLLDHETVLASWLDWWTFPAATTPNSFNARFRRFNLPESIAGPDALRHAPSWHIRVRGDAALATWASDADSYWAGEFTASLTAEQPGK